MEVYSSTFWLPKGGNSLNEYEDAFHSGSKGHIIGERISFAIADGASEGMLCGEWARVLVQSFCRDKNLDTQPIGFLERAYRSWERWIENYFKRRERNNKPIQWFEEDGLRNGAFSTLLGLKLVRTTNDQVGRWEATAIGDSCVFHVRNNKLIASFPLSNSAEFNNVPYLIPTNRNKGRNLAEAFKHAKGTFLIDDQFYLMTDALACWFFTEVEGDGHPWRTLQDLDTEDSLIPFEEWVISLRTTKKIRNDDVTLTRIEIVS